MAANIVPIPINTITEFIKHVEERVSANKKQLLFRGCRSEHELKPSLYRHRGYETVEQFLELEEKILQRFSDRSMPFVETELSTTWLKTFYMQHYHIPTRLLDWTENPLIALRFALSAATKNTEQDWDPEYLDAAVWILDPFSWNKVELEEEAEGRMLSLDDKADLDPYEPVPSKERFGNYPVALYGPHIDRRISAQRGVFTVFGAEMKPMEQIVEDAAFDDDCLEKLTFDSNLVRDLSDILDVLGISDSVLMPDIMGLSIEIRRAFGFKV